MSKTLTVYDVDGNESAFSLPTHFELCPCCEGRGTSSAYLGAFTRSDMDEMGPDFMEDYMAGAYDRTCERCNGLRVIEVVTENKLTAAQRKAYRQERQEEADYEAECRMERLMGC